MVTLNSSEVEPQFTMSFRGPAPVNAPQGTLSDTINGKQFSSFDAKDSLHNMTVGTVEQFQLDGVGHPMHVHVHPMQLQADSADGWHQKGDWIDVMLGVQPFPIVRTRIDQQLGLVVVHCHILGHEDGGLMVSCGLMKIRTIL